MKTGTALKYAIYYMIDKKIDHKTICSELGITHTKLNNTISQRSINNTTTKQDVMIMETMSKKSRNVAIMTAEASMLGDTIKNKIADNSKSAKMQDSVIFKPFNK